MDRCLNCMKSFEGGHVCPHCSFDNAGYQAVPYSLRPGSIIYGKYLIGRMLGQGGFGITYVGFDLSLEVKVAIKEYFPMNQGFRDSSVSNEVRMTTTAVSGGQWKNGCDAFLREARKMAKISTVPELVGVRETFGENNTAYIVMDYVEGVTLRNWLLKRGPMDFRSCVELLLPLMEGLDKVHSQGLIHRDISPDNIMIQPDGKPRLLDLGAAKDLSAGNSGASQLVVRHGFSPPEQYREQGEIGPWTDVYALCATIYYCVTGKMVPNALDRVDRDGLVFEGYFTDKQAKVLAAGLALERRKRIPTVSALTAQIRTAVDSIPGPVKKFPVAAAILAGVCMVAGGLFLGIFRKPVIDVAVGSAEPVGVVTLGCTNANLLQGANFAVIPGEYYYYADRDWNLYVSPYDQERSTFWIGTEDMLVVDDEIGFLNIGSDKVYFIHDEAEGSENPDSLMQMDFDGSNVEVLLSDEDYFEMQYAKLTNGKEYLYYLKEDGNPGDTGRTLCRLDLEQRTVQTLLEGIFGFNLYGEHIYYTEISADNPSESKWKCAGLDGQNEKVLNDSDNLVDGYVEDDTAYMYSLKEDMMYQYGLDGSKTGYSMVMSIGDQSVYGDGWLYYSRAGSKEVHRARPDGSYDEVIFEGHNITQMCYVNSQLWMLQTKDVDGKPVGQQTFLVNKDGSNPIAIENAYTDTMPDGLEYRVEEGKLVLVGYTGDEPRIVIPWEVDRETITGVQRSESFPEDVDIYFYPQDDELAYELTEDGTGAVLTGCGGGKTDGYGFIALPAEIDGMPIVKLGDELFKENTSIQGIILPEGLEEIGDYAFNGATGLSYVRLPNTLKHIGEWAFAQTKSLGEIILPEGLEEVGDCAFALGGLKQVRLPSTLTRIHANPFANFHLESIVLTDGMQEYFLEDGAVYDVGTDNAIRIVPARMRGSFQVARGTVGVGGMAFFGTNVTEVFLPTSIRQIYSGAFMNAEKLESVHMEEGIETIYDNAFQRCSSLREITIPQSVKEIGEKAFQGCESLQSVTVSGDCEIAEDAFDEGIQINYY